MLPVFVCKLEVYSKKFKETSKIPENSDDFKQIPKYFKMI